MNVNIFESHTSVNILCDASMFSAWLVALFILMESRSATKRADISRNPAFTFCGMVLAVPSCLKTLPYQLTLDLNSMRARAILRKDKKSTVIPN